jgi:hypothetical protein
MKRHGITQCSDRLLALKAGVEFLAWVRNVIFSTAPQRQWCPRSQYLKDNGSYFSARALDGLLGNPMLLKERKEIRDKRRVG